MRYLSTQRLANKPTGDCPVCDEERYLAFNWSFAQQGKDHPLSRFATHLTSVRSLKFGTLFQCRTCQGYWFLDEEGLLMERVLSDRMDVLLAWDATPLVLAVDHVNMLAEIGGVELEWNGNGRRSITLPCSIQTADGEDYEMALLLITKYPPLAEWQKHVMLGTDVRAVLPSDYALPFSVRRATLNADEIRMGFAPTTVTDGEGQHFVLNGPTSFFEYRSTKGKDLLVSTKSFAYADRYPVVEEDRGRVVYVYFDWFASCEQLAHPSS